MLQSTLFIRSPYDARITLAFDTTRLFHSWCLICVSLTYRGRAIPLAWRLLRHSSSTVRIKDIRPVLVSVHSLLSHLPQTDACVYSVWLAMEHPWEGPGQGYRKVRVG